MGRHRRSAAGPVAADHADAPAGRYQTGTRRRKKRAAPVRTGLLGVSAAVALGAVAVTSGVLPGGENFSISGGSGDRVSAEGAAGLETQGGSSARPTDRATTPAAQDTDRAHAPSKTPSAKPSEPSKSAPKPSAEPSTKPPRRESADDRRTEKPEPPKTTPPRRVVPTPSVKVPETGGGDDAGSGTATAAEAAVLKLVNQERATAGCSPVRADRALGALAQDFSEDMATRGFFDHTDPDGATPWDRAEKAGIDGLGGENIARGQADAEAVMDAWMNSAGHRANILNCEFKTLGVGVHTAPGGPWWTQNFGF
ncbi:CAP domain-containing protein [Streptomyces sp. NPDC054887]